MDAGSDAIAFIQRVKQRTAYDHKRATGQRLWQRSFHDRVLRPRDGARKLATYIFENPVRSGLADRADDWPYSGGVLTGR